MNEYINPNLLEYYSSFSRYKQQMEAVAGYTKARERMAKAVGEKGVATYSRRKCTIHTDWLECIEHSLDYIKKAIDEAREFIAQDGTVVPIEKAKKVSRQSIQHLSRHGEYLQNENEIPEKILIKENIDNYAIYENRFLYMAICYIRDFTDVRYKAITENQNYYSATLSLSSAADTRGKKYMLNLSFSESTENDEFAREDKAFAEAVARIEGIRYSVSSFLQTPIMLSLADAPLLKPPVTPTNVLKMDINFREVYNTYMSLCGYQGLGYTVTEAVTREHPLKETTARDVADILLLKSFILYKSGSDTEERLYAAWLAKEAKQQEGELWQALVDQNQKLTSDYFEQKDRIEYLEKQIAGLKEQEKTARIRWEAKAEDERKSFMEKHRDESEALKQSYEQRITLLSGQLDAAHRKAEELALKSEQAEQALEAEAQEKMRLSAALHSAQQQLGVADYSDYKTEKGFSYLEKEKACYEQFFQSAWKEAKKQIIKDVFSTKK